ncbi:hypothetical protein BZA05DRAFT_444919 [Tricharina praecox]|uniref:uncharacterized protein n=1 Tax=Tricharina praecox TaxID=43433 RepID=UPI00221E57CB|nr:uncharacterized protein BZA05DRAFT_444919 [Tricharina praecox]KAI5852390.1 hypothetical protein BZA05DRAFT_444919 [Tricharina praecox]
MHINICQLLGLVLVFLNLVLARPIPSPIPARSIHDIDAVLDPRPSNAYESKVNNNPGNIDPAQRAREEFREQHALEHGVKPKAQAKGRRPLRDITKKRVLEDNNRARHKQNDRLATIVEDVEGEKKEEEEEEEDLYRWGRPTVELGFGYNKGSKYDNRYGHLRAYDRTIDIEKLEEFAAGLAEDSVLPEN